jgi:hypothetical protein
MSVVLCSHVRRHQSSFFCHPHSSVLFPASTRVLRTGLPGQGPWRERLQPLTLVPQFSILPAPAFFWRSAAPKIRLRVGERWKITNRAAVRQPTAAAVTAA